MTTEKQRLWTIQIRQRLWVFTTPQLVWKAIVTAICVFGAVAIFYSAYLVYTVERSNRELASIAATENRYLGKNWLESERARQILLFAGNSLTKRLRSDPIRGNGDDLARESGQRDIRIVRQPYPTTKEVENLLGKADRQIQESDGVHWIWQRTLWEKPQGWPDRAAVDKPWRQVESKLLEAWFDSSGDLTSFMIVHKASDGTDSWEYIGRTPGDWRVSR